MRNYCTVCEWSTSTQEGYSRAEVSERSIEHYCTTGHSVDSGHRQSAKHVQHRSARIKQSDPSLPHTVKGESASSE